MEEPVKPHTTSTSRLRAARAVFFMVFTAQARFFSGWPAHSAGAKASLRASRFGSHTSCPARWLEMAQSPRSWSLRTARSRSQ